MCKRNTSKWSTHVTELVLRVVRYYCKVTAINGNLFMTFTIFIPFGLVRFVCGPGAGGTWTAIRTGSQLVSVTLGESLLKPLAYMATICPTSELTTIAT
jgi:hypothetical protein